MKKIYIISGVNYSVECNSIKERNLFNKLVKSYYNEYNSKYVDKQKFMFAVSMIIAKRLNLKFESKF